MRQLAKARRGLIVTTEITSAQEPEIRNLIYTIRGSQVMLDSDLAQLYQVETGALNRAAKRNEDRFPDDFRFRLERNELDLLRCQTGILGGQCQKNAPGRTYLPYAYTEQGVAMLSAILRSEIAVQVSVKIMRAFVEMRHFIASHAALFDHIRDIELRQLDFQETTNKRFERIFEYMNARETPKQKVFFEGQIYDAFELIVSLIRRAQHELVLIDGYTDISTLNLLAKKETGTSVIVWTHPKTPITQKDIDTFNVQHPQLTVRHTTAFHDRFLFLDQSQGYLIGASIKDAGKKSFAITSIEDPAIIPDVLAKLKE